MVDGSSNLAMRRLASWVASPPPPNFAYLLDKTPLNWRPTMESDVVHELRKHFQKTQIVRCGEESGPRGELCLTEISTIRG